MQQEISNAVGNSLTINTMVIIKTVKIRNS